MTALCPTCYGQRFEFKSTRVCSTCKGNGRIPIPAEQLKQSQPFTKSGNRTLA